MPKAQLAKKLSMASGVISLMLMVGSLLAGHNITPPCMATIFAGSLVAFAISEQNPKEE